MTTDAEAEATEDAASVGTLAPSDATPEEGDLVLAVGRSKFNEDVVHREAGYVTGVQGAAVRFENGRGDWLVEAGGALSRDGQELTHTTEVYLVSLWDVDGLLPEGG